MIFLPLLLLSTRVLHFCHLLELTLLTLILFWMISYLTTRKILYFINFHRVPPLTIYLIFLPLPVAEWHCLVFSSCL